MVLIGSTGDRIPDRTVGELINTWRQLRSMRNPIVLDLRAELVELLDALAVRAQLTLRTRCPQTKKPEYDAEHDDGGA